MNIFDWLFSSCDPPFTNAVALLVSIALLGSTAFNVYRGIKDWRSDDDES